MTTIIGDNDLRIRCDCGRVATHIVECLINAELSRVLCARHTSELIMAIYNKITEMNERADDDDMIVLSDVIQVNHLNKGSWIHA